MPNRELKDERRKVGQADPATRRRLMNEAMGIKGPDGTQRAKPVAAKPAAPAPSRSPGITGQDVSNGVMAIKNRKRDIERAVDDAQK